MAMESVRFLADPPSAAPPRDAEDGPRFGILGSLRIRSADTFVTRGSPQQQAFMAALLLQPGHAATLAELVDALWGDCPPDTAVTTIRTHAWWWRRLLEKRGAIPRVLVSVGDGYQIALPGPVTDLETVGELADRAAQARREGREAEAAALLSHALGLWRGHALAGVPGAFAAQQRSRLTELRTALSEEYFDLQLALGRAAIVVPDLFVLSERHPLRERAHGLLMRALHATGRQAEALAVFGRVRRLLVAEHGIAPSPLLVQLHQQILEGDPALDHPAGPLPAGPVSAEALTTSGRGDVMSSGTFGAAGSAGVSGASGAAGTPGAAGVPAASGAFGTAGPSHAADASGAAGTPAASGAFGPAGTPAATGASGALGTSDASGASAALAGAAPGAVPDAAVPTAPTGGAGTVVAAPTGGVGTVVAAPTGGAGTGAAAPTAPVAPASAPPAIPAAFPADPGTAAPVAPTVPAGGPAAPAALPSAQSAVPVAVPAAALERRGPVAWPVPRQLPGDIGDFAGRTESLRAAVRALTTPERTGPAIVVVGGSPGSGKSVFAVRAAHRVHDDYPAGQLYADLCPGGTAADPAQVLAGFLQSLGLPAATVPDGLANRSALFRSVVDDLDLLVVLDNALDLDQVRPLLPGSPRCGVLLTGRAQLSALSATERVRLEPFAVTESLDLLSSAVGASRVAADRAGAIALVRACGMLPAAVRAAGARLAARPQWPFGALTGLLGEGDRRLRELSPNDPSLTDSFERGYRQLAPAQAEAWQRLAPHGPDISLPGASSVLRISELQAERVLEELVDASMLESPAYRRYRYPDLLLAFARAKQAEAGGTGRPVSFPAPGAA
ncbi:AfsR/SARP family transcriptional regulator [Streptantibioticus silvisoli]|uniref:AfsR/SARP family transcriptional regulator n=1 Tax=Streptantibioticus silvisoli TaxID=2705255 RepID=A0ABT6VVX8_9ACTN|nr:AfsR/SARP family transcriptional regulator [Streptantibioticus silvisoli]MDI5962179.1 AfsR/SARP family transcriptional regulator [Streptantibioticus silvisoli]